MINGFSSPKLSFGERLEYLMKQDGINIVKKGADRELSKRMYNKGVLHYSGEDYDTKNKNINTARRRIEEHRKVESASNISGYWLKAYCDYFHCSADYLFGYIELPTHEKTNIKNATGLSVKAIERITSKNGNIPKQDFLNSFILSEEYIEIEHSMGWIKNNCHNIKYYYSLCESVKSATKKAKNQEEFYKLDDMLCEYANKLEHNGSQIQFLMYQCNLSFGNFLNGIRKSWSNEVRSTLETLEKPLPGLDSAKKYYKEKAPDTD